VTLRGGVVTSTAAATILGVSEAGHRLTVSCSTTVGPVFGLHGYDCEPMSAGLDRTPLDLIRAAVLAVVLVALVAGAFVGLKAAGFGGHPDGADCVDQMQRHLPPFDQTPSPGTYLVCAV
jgi:hypothetical protein